MEASPIEVLCFDGIGWDGVSICDGRKDLI
jgi:hypothetical protein